MAGEINNIKIFSSDLNGVDYGECAGADKRNCASIEVRNLSLSYGSSRILENISLSFSPCSITALIGPSGCGKTSFLQCLNRLVDLVPGSKVSGDVNLGRTNINDKDADLIALRRRIGMIFQKPSPFPFSVSKNFHLPLKEHGISDRKARAEIIEKSLRDVGLWKEVKDRLNKPATELSGGQQQRLCIARAIALNPEVLLMDEPCSALDPISSGVVEDLICKLRGRYTIVVVTHNIAQARRIADEIAFFWTKGGVGTLVERGKASEVFAQPKSEITSAYLSGARG